MQNRPHILLVEAQRMSQLVAKFFFTSLNCTLDIVTHAEAALQKIQEKTYDLVITELHLPDMDCGQFLAGIRSVCADSTFPILALSGARDASTQQNALQKGFNEYHAKPLNEDICREILGKYMAGKLGWTTGLEPATTRITTWGSTN